jgi:hypothetical protein
VSHLLAGGSALPGVVVEGVKEGKKAFQAVRNVQRWHQNGRFPALIDLKIAENAVFLLKST